MSKLGIALAAGLVVGAATGAAQSTPKFRVTPSFGVIRFDRTSALSSTSSGISKLWASAGLSALYQFRPNLQAGFYLETSRPATSPDYYPYALIQTAGKYQLFAITQRVVVLSYGLSADVGVPVMPKLAPHLRLGIGRHSVYEDVQQEGSVKTVNGLEFVVGGGLRYSVGNNVGVQLEAVDFLWKDWDRDVLNPTQLAYQNTVFPEDNPDGINWTKPSLIHNLRLAIGFTFTPASGGTR
jgi:opacity protein-like surface antigen